jgi:hypothetical protein
MKLEKATLIANFYERNRADSALKVRNFLCDNRISHLDARAIVHAVRQEIDKIQTLQDEQNLMEQIAQTGDHEPQHVEVVIGREFIKRTASWDVQDVLGEPDEMVRNLDVIAKVAYKYQLKYALIVFEIMLDDDEIWEPTTVH